MQQLHDPAHPANIDLSIPPFLDRRSERTGTAGGWRDRIKVHPAADLFPLMSELELRDLGEDIKAKGTIHHPIVLYQGKLLDGRNRLDAMEMVGFDFDLERGHAVHHLDRSTDPYEYVISANLHRRHLTSEQKRDLIAKVLKAKPEASNATVAKQTKADDKTVAKVRRKLESTSEIPKLEKTVGADGKQRKSRARATKPPQPPAARATGSDEIDVDQRRQQMAQLDQPAEETVDEVDRRVSCVANTIRGHVNGLTHSDGARFFAALRDRIDDIEREVS
jgi:hypothetical protein